MSTTINKGYPIFGEDENTGYFKDFRLAIAGTSDASAIVKIDKDIALLETSASEMSSKITELYNKSCSVEQVTFTYDVDAQNYVGEFVDSAASVSANMIVMLSIDSNEIETNIVFNFEGSTYELQRYDYDGNLIGVVNTVLVPEKEYLAYYNGETFVLIGQVINEGEAGEMTVKSVEAEKLENINSGDNLKTVFGKLRKWFSSLGTFAWKSSLSYNDLEDKPTDFAPSEHTHKTIEIEDLATVASSGSYDDLENIPMEFTPATHTHNYSELTGVPKYEETDPTVPSWAKAANKPIYTAQEIGLGNVENIRQYSANNEPPYPVTNVNGKTGSIVLTAEDISYLEEDTVQDKLYQMDMAQSNLFDAIGLKADEEHKHVSADISDLQETIIAAIEATTMIYSSTSEPTSSDGKDGDIWIQYS